MKKTKSGFIARAGITAALYVVFTLPLGSLAYAPFFQIRPAEALTILPLLMPSSVIGVTVGCMIVNIFGGGLWDMVLGGGITFLACVVTKYSKKIGLGVIPPIIFNAAGLPLVFILLGYETGYWYSFFQMLLSQTVWVCGLGIPLYYAVKKLQKQDNGLDLY
ncbi:MAG: QueT transporter family protein [Bacillota bacterium]